MRHEHRLAIAAATLLATGIVVALRGAARLEPLGLKAYDLIARASTADTAIDSTTLVIGVTELDITRFGWPLADSTLDRALTILQRAGASVVALDVYRTSACPPSPLATWTAGLAPVVIFAEKLGTTASDAVHAPACVPADRVGFTDVVPDADHVLRRTLYIGQLRDSTKYSLSYRAVESRLAQEGISPSYSHEYLPSLGNWTLVPFEGSDGEYVHADAGGYQTLLAGAPAVADIPNYSLASLLDGEIPAEVILGRMVFVGATAASLPDLQPIGGSSSEHDPVPGVFAHALAASQALHLALGDRTTAPVSTLPDWLEWIYLILAGTLGGWLALVSTSIPRLVLGVVVAQLCVLAVAWLAMQISWWVPLAPPALALVLSAATSLAVLAILEQRDRGALMDLFSRHVSRAVAADIWHRRSEFAVGGRPTPIRVPVTVLFADVRGYTSIAERSEPERLMSWLNSFMSSMADEVIRHDGVIDDYAGDGIKADFGVPLQRHNEEGPSTDARRAVDCAVAMAVRLDELNQQFETDRLPPIGMRIGIASGLAVAGSVGSPDRLKYTVVGDVVNRAARLESLDKEYDADDGLPCRILIDQPTHDAVAGQFDCRPLGAVHLKGKELPVEVYQVRTLRTSEHRDA